MYVYPVTFIQGTATIHGELVTDVTIPAAQDWTIIPAPNGQEYWGYPAGNPPAPAWTTTVPDFINQNAGFSINVLTSYVTPTVGVTLVLNGAPPAGWTFNTGTNLLNYDGVTVSGPVTLSFTATLTSDGATANSNSFTVSGVGVPAGDTSAPTAPIGISVSGIGQTTATISGSPSADPAPVNIIWSGMLSYSVTVPGAPGSPFTITAPDSGIQASLIFGDIGSQTSTITQSGSTLTFSTTAKDAPYPTNSALAFAYLQLAGTSWTIRGRVPSGFTSTGGYDNLRLEVRSTLSSTGAYCAINQTPFGGSSPFLSSEARAVTGGNAAGISSIASAIGPVDEFITRLNDTYTFSYSVNGGPIQSLGSVTMVLGATVYVGWGANTSAGGPMVAQQFQQCGISADPNWTFNLSSLTASTNYSVTATAKDNANNVSAASVPVSFTTSAPAGGGGSGNFPMILGRFLDWQGSSVVGKSFNDTTWQHAAARYSVVTMLSWCGSEVDMQATTPGVTYASIMSGMKSYATASLGGHKLLTGFERNDEEHIIPGGANQSDTVLTNALANVGGNRLGWGVQGSGYPGGALIPGSNGPTFYEANFGSACPSYNVTAVGTLTGPGMVNWSQFSAWYEYQALVAGKVLAMENGSAFSNGYQFAANSNVDTIDHDNQFMVPRYNGCWLSNSTVYQSVYNGYGTTGANVVAPYLQTGYKQTKAMWKSLSPNIKFIGNVDYSNYYGKSTYQILGDMAGLYDYAMVEAPVGQTWSMANNRTFAQFLAALVSNEQTVATGGYSVWLMEGRDSTHTWDGVQYSAFSAPDFQSIRYQTGMACLLRWLIGNQPFYNDVFWMDEWDAGVGNLGWLGTPVGTRNLTPNSKGIYVIPFTGGTVYLNPAGANDSYTTSIGAVQLISGDLVGGGGHHITYSSSTRTPFNVISGASFNSLNILVRDAIFTKP